jgi:hypothetical protein
MQEMEFLKSPQENLGTWNMLCKLLIIGSISTMAFLGILALTLV